MKTLFLTGTLFFLWAGTALSAAVHEVTCGATLSHKKFTLSADLDCSTSTTPTITLRDNAELNLNGHSLTGLILLDGKRTTLRNGKVICLTPDVCITLGGEGGHLLENVFTDGTGNTVIIVLVTSDNNSLIGNTTYDGPGIGFFGSNANNNVLRGNIAHNTGEVGFWIAGNGNQLSYNSTTGHLLEFIIHGNGNVVTQNTASGNLGGADEAVFAISGDNNRISRNVASSPFFSSAPAFTVSLNSQNNTISDNLAPFQAVEDQNPNCDNNTWTGNIFGSANQACIQ